MTEAATLAAPNFIQTSSASVLREISREEIQLAIWQRPALAMARGALEELLRVRKSVRIETSSIEAGAWQRSLEHCLDQPSEATRAGCAALATDFVALAEKFREISGRQHLRLRFERVEDDGCALFHVDTLPLRMLCTYAGPGTQWLEETNVRRDQLGSRGRSLMEANAAIVIDPEEIRTVPAWHVIAFKGRLWGGHGYSDGLVHRSAPVRHENDFRLRLTLDWSDSCNC